MSSLTDQLQASLGESYDVAAELGGGGMSHVFRATDIALGRDVVVKLLPVDAAAALSSERFKREIALAAKLQHPHIVPLLSAGTTESGLPYYIMPFVEGESLRGRLIREGELPNGDVVGILREVARALAYAHDRGVVHRDIKPDNVMLSGGSVMVTDFGVAKAVTASMSGEHAAGFATTLTQLGISLGTPAYMAPEQAASDPSVDRRADLYALGCMAYEMLTGSTPFAGRNVSSTLAAHVTELPEPITRRRPSVPPALAALVMQCLEKHAADRPASAHEVLRALDSASQTPVSGVSSYVGPGVPPYPAALERGRARRWVAAIPWLLVVLLAAWVVWSRRANTAAVPAPIRVAIVRLPDEGPLLAESDPVVSPDGTTLVYRAAIGAGSRLDQRFLGEFTSHPIPGTEGATHPFYSVDGKWLAYFADGKLLRMPSEGGPSTFIAELPAVKGASWAPNGDIILGAPVGVRGAGLSRIPAGGGAPVPLTHLGERSGEAHSGPIVLPDGKVVLFASEDGSGKPSGDVIAVASLETGAFAKLPISGERPLGVIDGWLVYTRVDGALMAMEFDERTMRVRGNEKALGITVADYALNVSLSPSGTLVYSAGNTKSRLVWVDSHGTPTSLFDEPREYEFPRLSPDGTRIAFSARGALTVDVWVGDIASGRMARFTSQGSINDRPEWSADSKRLLFRSTRDSASALWWQPADGSGEPERLTQGTSVWEGMLSPDNSTLLYRETIPGKSGYRIMYSALAGDRTPKPLPGATGNVQMPRFSPDGRWVAYQSDESGQFEIYAKPFPSGAGRIRVSNGGGTEPLWSADGRRLFYRSGTQLVTATVVPGATLTVTSRSEALLDPSAQTQSRTHPKYDVARDGRVVMPRWLGEGTTLGVVVHWDEELRKAVRK